MYLLLKAALSGLIVAVASEIARRSTLFGAVLISLPLVSILAIVWLYRDSRDIGAVTSLSWAVLWAIVPSLVFFVSLPFALRVAGFWFALAAACAATAVGYAFWVWVARRAGLDF